MGAELATQQFHPPLGIVEVFRRVLDGEEGDCFPVEGGTLLEIVENLTTGGILDREPVLQGFSLIPRRRGERDGESVEGDEDKKEEAAGQIIERLEAVFPGLDAGLDYMEVGTARSHRRFLGREDGTYGPIPRRKLRGLLGMPFNRTAIPGLYCVGDSTFPGQGLNAVAFSGFACAHRVAVDLGL